ncbi:MAG: 3-hydroxyacyl-CoA dehydrogenase family protein [Candidatus Dormibacteria bacterium]
MSAPGHPELVAVIGGGTMGVGIAQVLLAAGCQVVVVESGAGRAADVEQRLHAQIERARARGHLTLEGALDQRLQVVATFAGIGRATLVVEAVPERLDVKRAVLRAVDDVVGQTTLIASNTSSMSITTLAEAVRSPERFLGMHFFNPVPRSQLVELVTGPQTSAETVGRARQWVERLQRTPIVVRDAPGFASSRLGIVLGMEAIRMLEEEVASADDIDAAMVLGYRHPMGPLRLTDLVGLDVRLSIAEHLSETLGNRFAPPQLLRSMVAEGKLGQKSGEGFYRW